MKNISYFLIMSIATIIVACSNNNDKKINQNNEISLRAMSYNIRTCRGGDSILGKDKEYRYNLVSNIINRVNPDFVAIQEIDSATERSDNDYILKELSERTSMFPTFVPSIKYQNGKYGIGLLSKEKPISYHRIPLPGKEEIRSLLIVEFEKYIVGCTHLSLNQNDRIASVSIIKESVKDFKKPFILAGDMNSEVNTDEQDILLEKFEILNDYTQNTIPTYKPNKCIDFIYGLKNGYLFSVESKNVLFGEKDASDHLPLYIDVKIKKKN